MESSPDSLTLETRFFLEETRFFLEPASPAQRQYEALRAYFVEGVSSADVSDRKRTRLNPSHLGIPYAVFCLKKKTAYRDALLRPGQAAQRPHTRRPAPPP